MASNQTQYNIYLYLLCNPPPVDALWAFTLTPGKYFHVSGVLWLCLSYLIEQTFHAGPAMDFR